MDDQQKSATNKTNESDQSSSCLRLPACLPACLYISSIFSFERWRINP